jgi:phage baseplate assembly protein W
LAVEITAYDGSVVIGATGLVEIYQNVRTIISTEKGSLLLDREFGLSNVFLDHPLPLAIQKAIPEIVEAVEKYEIRVAVTAAFFVPLPDTDLANGRLVPKVRIKIKDEYT